MPPEATESSPQIDDTAWVANNATVVGDVALGREVTVWYTAVIRADVEVIAIGERTNVQDNCVLHADPGFPLRLGAGVSIGHSAILHGCEVGDDVLVGMGAIVMNGAKIGRGSIVAAGSLVPEGACYPERSLILGSPARVRREVTEPEQRVIRDNAELYVNRRPKA